MDHRRVQGEEVDVRRRIGKGGPIGGEESGATLVYGWEPRRESPQGWAERLLDWLALCEQLDSRLSGWTESVTGQPIPAEAGELGELMVRLGEREVGGTWAKGVLSIYGHRPPGATTEFHFSIPAVFGLAGGALTVPTPLLVERTPGELGVVMGFVADSSAAMGARWAAWRFWEQVGAMNPRAIGRDHAGWITYYEGVDPARLRRLREPAVGETAGDGVVVASMTSLEGATGESLAEAAARVERDLFGWRRRPTRRD